MPDFAPPGTPTVTTPSPLWAKHVWALQERFRATMGRALKQGWAKGGLQDQIQVYPLHEVSVRPFRLPRRFDGGGTYPG